jgi:hypothetical protein
MNGYGPRLTRAERKVNRQTRRYEFGQTLWRVAKFMVPLTVALGVLGFVVWWEVAR